MVDFIASILESLYRPMSRLLVLGRVQNAIFMGYRKGHVSGSDIWRDVHCDIEGIQAGATVQRGHWGLALGAQ